MDRRHRVERAKGALLLLALLGGCGRTSLFDGLECLGSCDESGGGNGKGGSDSSGANSSVGGSMSVTPPPGPGSAASAGTTNEPQGGAVGAEGGASPGLGGAGGEWMVCDEFPDDCTRPIDVGRVFGQAYTYWLEDLAVTPAGHFALAVGSYYAAIDFGPPTSPLTGAGDSDVFIASFEGNGTPVWAETFGTEYQDHVTGIAFDPAGPLIMTGYALTASSYGATLKKLDAMGNTEWSRFFEHAAGLDVAVASDGTIAATGTFREFPVDFDGQLVEATMNDGAQHVYVAKFDAGGDCTWARQFTSWSAVPTGIDIDSSDDIVVVGTFGYDIDFGQGKVAGSNTTDLFISKFSPYGDLIFANTFAGSNWQTLQGVAIDSADAIVVAGGFDGSLDFGAGEMEGSTPLYIAKFDGGGNALWSKVIESSSGEAFASDIAVDPTNHVVVTGSFQGTLGTPLAVTAVERDAFILKLDSNGDFVWVGKIGNQAEDDGLAVGTDDAGNVFAAGRFLGWIDVGGGLQSSLGPSTNVFLVKFAP